MEYSAFVDLAKARILRLNTKIEILANLKGQHDDEEFSGENHVVPQQRDVHHKRGLFEKTLYTNLNKDRTDVPRPPTS